MAATDMEVGPAGFARSDIEAYRRRISSHSRSSVHLALHSPVFSRTRGPTNAATEASRALMDALGVDVMPAPIEAMRAQVEALHERELAPGPAQRLQAVKEPPQLALEPARPDPKRAQVERGAAADDIELDLDTLPSDTAPSHGNDPERVRAAPVSAALPREREDVFEPYDRHLAELAMPAARACMAAFTGLLDDREAFEAVSAGRRALRICRLACDEDAGPIHSASEAALCAGEGLARCKRVLAAVEAAVPLEDSVGDARLGSLSFASLQSAKKWRDNAVERYRGTLESLLEAVRSPPRRRGAAGGNGVSFTAPGGRPSSDSTVGGARMWCCCLGGGASGALPPAERRPPASAPHTAAAAASATAHSPVADPAVPAPDTSVSEVELRLHVACMELERLLLQATNPGITVPGTPKTKLTSGIPGLRDAVAASLPDSQLLGHASTIVDPVEAALSASPELRGEAAGEDGVIDFEELMAGAPRAQPAGAGAPGSDIVRPAALWRPLMRPSRSPEQEVLAVAFALHYGLDPATPYVARAESLAARLPLALYSVKAGHTPPTDALVMLQETGAALTLAAGILYQQSTDDDGVSFAPVLVQRTVVMALLTAERAVHGVVGCLVQWALLLRGKAGGGRMLYQCLALWRELALVRRELVLMRVVTPMAGRTYRGEAEAPAREAALSGATGPAWSGGAEAGKEGFVPGLWELESVLHSSMRRHWRATGDLMSSLLEQEGTEGLAAAQGLERTLSRLEAGVRAVDVFVGPVGEAIASWSLDVLVDEEQRGQDEEVASPMALPAPRLPVPAGGVDSAWASTVLARYLSNAALVETKVALHMLPPHLAPTAPAVFGVGVSDDTGTAVVKAGALAVGVFGVFVRILRLFKRAGADLHGVLAELETMSSPGATAVVEGGFVTCPTNRTIGARLTDAQLEASVLEMQSLFQPYVRAWITVRRRVVEQDTLARALREGLRTGLASLRPSSNIMHSAVAGLLFQFAQYTIGELRALPALLSPEDVSRAGVMLLTWPVAALARRCTAAALLCISDQAHGSSRTSAHRSTSWLLARRDAAWLMADAVTSSDRFGATAGATGAAGIPAGGAAGPLPFGSASAICTEALAELRAQDAVTVLSPARQAQMELLSRAAWPAKPASWHALFARFFQLAALTDAQRHDSEETLRRVVVLLNDAVYCHQAVSQVLNALDNLRVAEPWSDLEAVDMELQRAVTGGTDGRGDALDELDVEIRAAAASAAGNSGPADSASGAGCGGPVAHDHVEAELRMTAAAGGDAGRAAKELLENQRCVMRALAAAPGGAGGRRTEAVERHGPSERVVVDEEDEADSEGDAAEPGDATRSIAMPSAADAAAEEGRLLSAAAREVMAEMEASSNALPAAAAEGSVDGGVSAGGQMGGAAGMVTPSPWASPTVRSAADVAGGNHRAGVSSGAAGLARGVRIGPLPDAVTGRASPPEAAAPSVVRVESRRGGGLHEAAVDEEGHREPEPPGTPVGLSAALPASMLREETRSLAAALRASLSSSLEVRALRLRVAVQHAADVPWLDAHGFSKSDPYVSITLAPSHGELSDGAVVASQLTGVVENSSAPVWNEKFVLTTALGRDPWLRLSMHDWDGDESQPDDFVGSVALPLAPLLDQGAHAVTAWMRPNASDPKAFGTVDAALPIPLVPRGRRDVVEGKGAAALAGLLAMPSGGAGSTSGYVDPVTDRPLPAKLRQASLGKAVCRLTFMVAVDSVPIRLAAMYTIGSGLREAVRALSHHLVRGASQLLLAGIADVKASARTAESRDQLASACAEPVLAYLSDRFDAVAEHAYAQLLGPLAEEVIAGISALALRLLLPRLKRFSGAMEPHAALAGRLAGPRTARSWFGAVVGASASTLWLEAAQVTVLSHTVMSVIQFFSRDRFPLSKRRAMTAAEPVPAVMAWWFAAPDFLAARSGTLVIKAIAAHTKDEEARIGETGGIATPKTPASTAVTAATGGKGAHGRGGGGASRSESRGADAEADALALETELKRWMATGMIGDESVASKGLKSLEPAASRTPRAVAERKVDDFNIRGVSIGVLIGMLEYRVEKMGHAAAAQNLGLLRKSREVAIAHVEAAIAEDAAAE